MAVEHGATNQPRLGEPAPVEKPVPSAEPVASGRISRLNAGVHARAQSLEQRYEARAVDRPILGIPLVVYRTYLSRQGVLMASALAFRLFLWLLPAALLGAGILAGISSSHSAGLKRAAKDTGAGGIARQQVLSALQAGHRSWWIAVVIGAVGFIWGTRSLMQTIAYVNAHCWQTHAKTYAGRRRYQSLGVIVVLVPILVFLSTLLTELDRGIAGGVVVVTVVEAAILTAAWLGLVSTLPDRRRDLMDLVPGSIVVGASFAVLHAVSRVYLPRKIEQSSALYGSFGTAGVILAWLLILGEVIVSGSLINAAYSEHRLQREDAVHVTNSPSSNDGA
jgi:uncharacterized BrkB/YihY/UPF0761 family membrane protein